MKKIFGSNYSTLQKVMYFILCFLISAGLFKFYHLQQNIDQKALQETSTQLLSKMDIWIERYTRELRASSAVYEASHFNPDESLIQTYAASRNFHQDLSGALGVGFVRFIKEGQVSSYLKKRQLKNKDFKIRRLSDQFFHPNKNQFIIEAIEPRVPNQAVIGLDLSSEIQRHNAAEYSMNTGQSALTGKIQLVQDKKKHPGFLIYSPIYSSIITPASEKKRQELIVGWTYSPFLLNNYINSFYHSNKSSFYLKIVDLTDNGTLLYSSIPDEFKNKFKQHLILTQKINLSGRHWQITLIDKKEQWNAIIIIKYCLSLAMIAAMIYWLMVQAIKYYQIFFLNQETVKSLEVWQNSILESVQSSVISTNIEGVITTFNSTASKMLGYGPSEMIGKETPAIIHDMEEVIARAKILSHELNLEITPGFNVFVVKAQKNGIDVNEWTYIHKNGTRFPVTLSVTPLYGHNKSLIGYLGVAQDLSAINIAKNKLKQIMHGIERGAIVASTDVTGKIIEVNDKFCEITGYSKEELLGKDHRIINSKTHPPDFFKTMWQTISAGEVWSGEICNRNKNGEIYWVQTMITPLLNNNKEIERYLAIRIDITQKKLLEKTYFQQSQMLSLGEMAGGIAHEINNPLTIIQGMTTTLKTKMNKNEIDETFFSEKLDKIYNSAQRIASIIKNMKALSQDSLKDETENIPVITIVDNTISLCQEKFLHNKVGITIINNIQQTKIQCHPSQISQALINLLNNAYDVANISPHKWIKLYLEESNNTVTISVVDPGQGIADEITDKIMWPFFTTKEIGKATGLGLSTAKTLIESNGGTLAYQKRQNNTCFIVELPKNS